MGGLYLLAWIRAREEGPFGSDQKSIQTRLISNFVHPDAYKPNHSSVIRGNLAVGATMWHVSSPSCVLSEPLPTRAIPTSMVVATQNGSAGRDYNRVHYSYNQGQCEGNHPSVWFAPKDQYLEVGWFCDTPWKTDCFCTPLATLLSMGNPEAHNCSSTYTGVDMLTTK